MITRTVDLFLILCRLIEIFFWFSWNRVGAKYKQTLQQVQIIKNKKKFKRLILEALKAFLSHIEK